MTNFSNDDGAAEFMDDVRRHEAMEKNCGALLVAPGHIRLTIDARRIAKQESDDFEDHMTDALGRDDPVDFGDFGAGTRGEQNHRSIANGNTPPKVRAEGLAAFMADLDEAFSPTDLGDGESIAESDIGGMLKPRHCNIPATLRAIDIPATEHDNPIQQWFYNHDAMCQFLAGRCLFIETGGKGGSVKDDEGNHVGMWFYAHFGPTPVS